jgi:acid phosphatase
VFTHVFVIVMENTSLDTLDSATNAPYLAGLKAAWATGADYHGAAAVHPSLPNYIAMTSGGSQGITCDCNPTGKACTTCNAFSNNCGCNRAVPHLGDQIETAKKTWKAYGESMGTPCNLTGSGDYAPKHIPFLYYDNVQTPASRCSSHVVDYNAFAADLAGATPDFSFIAPNLVDDMHGTGFIQSSSDIAAGDTWLATHAKAILESPAFKSGGLFVIVWDEDDHSGIPNADDPIPVFVMSPYAKTKFRSTVHADHYSLLATIEDGLRLPRLGLATAAAPLTDYFPAK